MYIYRVKSGESAASIAAKFGRSESCLIRVNPQIPRKIVYYAGVPYTVFNNLYIGQNLIIPPQWVIRNFGLSGFNQQKEGQCCNYENTCVDNNVCINNRCVDYSQDGLDNTFKKYKTECEQKGMVWNPNTHLCGNTYDDTLKDTLYPGDGCNTDTNQGADIQSSPASELTCEKGMHKECTNDDCKCVETSNAIYWVLGGLGVVVLAAIGVSAYRAYRGMPEPGTIWVQGGGAQPVLPLREPTEKFIVLYRKGARVGSRPLDELDELKSQFRMQFIQRDKTGTEHWNIIAPIRTRKEAWKAGYRGLREPMRVRGVEGDMVWITYMGQKSDRFLPDVKITKDNPRYVLYPMHGYSGQLAVGDENGQLIGWMPIDVLGFDNVKEWMKAVNYIV